MSDERREVAERLREAALHPDVDGDVWVYDATAALGLEVGGYEGYITPESVERLADLIDPTCEIIRPISPGKFGVCSACGALVNMRDSVANATNYLKPLYCPNCGARVVRGDGD